MVGESQEAVGAAPGAGGAAGGSKTPTLEEFGSDLTKQAEEVRPGVPEAKPRGQASDEMNDNAC